MTKEQSNNIGLRLMRQADLAESGQAYMTWLLEQGITYQGHPLPASEKIAIRSQKDCRLGRHCLNSANGKPAKAVLRKRYCSPACEGRAALWRKRPELSKVARAV